jgi:hypothetical protein
MHGRKKHQIYRFVLQHNSGAYFVCGVKIVGVYLQLKILERFALNELFNTKVYKNVSLFFRVITSF